MKRVLTCTLVVACSSLLVAPSSAGSPRTPSATIDAALRLCLDKADTTAAMLECYGTASEKMDQQLNRDYRTLMDELPAAQQPLLRDAQKKWLQYRDAEQQLAEALDPNAGGSLARVNASGTSYELLKQRVAELESYLRSRE